MTIVLFFYDPTSSTDTWKVFEALGKADPTLQIRFGHRGVNFDILPTDLEKFASLLNGLQTELIIQKWLWLGEK